VPSVLVPWGRDQPGVAARAEALGVARVLPRDRLTVEALARTIREALADRELRARCIAHGERIRGYEPARRACETIEAAFFA
jgi:UDP:flavonoid glycosyltransferase YjiC (YdhE family)